MYRLQNAKPRHTYRGCSGHKDWRNKPPVPASPACHRSGLVARSVDVCLGGCWFLHPPPQTPTGASASLAERRRRARLSMGQYCGAAEAMQIRAVVVAVVGLRDGLWTLEQVMMRRSSARRLPAKDGPDDDSTSRVSSTPVWCCPPPGLGPVLRAARVQALEDIYPRHQAETDEQADDEMRRARVVRRQA
ncbi:uncharacterized protein MAM_05792 [Metarhizium album ARSEF 1941]|uniref:Uncharacterized protein n=1 Tax=Metarhizium album (strain ARSEF 1941) TaxID=1081103 RepID=A0A0B2WR61_METAS|nr:uncharacterized protein MAM_05792 [Metarhizium album ARSEF 1941]KHN96503.1 hypothetical protein MAM_05792 [Metarhizium album ARSEF 1941]